MEERLMTQTRSTFHLGRIVATPGALAVLQAAGQQPHEFLSRHLQADWGDIPAEDKQENERALREGFRILSAYHTRLGEKVGIISEADRSATTILLPSGAL
jgi:hypothetical protein